jgi:hypothetical protein
MAKMPKAVKDRFKNKPASPKHHPMPSPLKQHHDKVHGPGYKVSHKIK